MLHPKVRVTPQVNQPYPSGCVLACRVPEGSTRLRETRQGMRNKVESPENTGVLDQQPHPQISEEGTARTLRSSPNGLSPKIPPVFPFCWYQAKPLECFHFVDTVNLIIDLFFPSFYSEPQSQIGSSLSATIQHMWHALCILSALGHFLFSFLVFFITCFCVSFFFFLDKRSQFILTCCK